MNDIQFNVAVTKWEQTLESVCHEMISTTNDAGEYPQIDFNPMVAEFRKLITGMEAGRKEKPSLIVLPGGVAR